MHLLVLTALVEWIAIDPVVASGGGFFVAVLTNYTLQHCWVFKADGHHKTYFLRYAGVTLLTFALNLFLFWWLFAVLRVWYPVSQVIATGIIFIINFIINRNYTFYNRLKKLEH